MRNYKLTISYDGSRYRGWQRQPDTDKTIQGTLEQTISKVLGYGVTIDGSGRTDGGVHAWAQVANVHTSGKLDPLMFRDQINELLPEDIRVKQVELVKNSFHSRHSADGKHYTYTIDTREKANVFTRRYTYHYTETLNIEAMEQAIAYLVGTHDFASVCDKKDEKSTVRSIYDIRIRKNENLVILDYYGSGFLNHMVRILTGTLLEVGTGLRDPHSIPKMLEAKERAQAGPIAPAQGLCMAEVYYDRADQKRIEQEREQRMTYYN